MSVAALVVLGNTAATAQDYRFQVPEAVLHVYVLPDASARLEYEITFFCQAGAHVIDIVDVGLPHRGYQIGNMSASINGQRLSDIRKSAFVDVGVEVHLGGSAIRPGQQGKFQFTCTMPDLVYQDTTRKDFASLRITPTWYGSELVVGATNLSIFVYVPQGIEADEVVYQLGRNFDAKGTKDGQTFVGWSFPTTRFTAEHFVGLSFPKRSMTRVVHVSTFGLLVKWFEESKKAQLISGSCLAVGLAVLFFRFSGGTGCTVFVILLVGLIVLFTSSPKGHLLTWPVMLGLIAWNEWHLSYGRKRHKYLPAIVSVEGGGIKRGLTAPEAAVLLELPLGKVLSLVIFGLLKKGIVRQVEAEGFIVETVPEFCCPRKRRNRVASEKGTVVHGYEHAFIDLLMKNTKPARDLGFTRPMRELIETTAKRLAGFDADETRDYYRRIVARAWTEAESIGEIRQREKAVDQWFDWMVLDENWTGRFDRWEGRGWHYRPSWSRGGIDVGRSAAGGGGSRGPDVGGHTTLGDVSASFAGWAENTAGGFASTIDPTGLGLPQPQAGVLDLSGVDRVTADVFKAMAESSGKGGGGGGGGGCACACAGCACACACAGGGR